MSEAEPLKEFISKYEKLKILPQNVRDFIMTLLPKSIQKKIASLVQQSNEVKKKAKELLEMAKKPFKIATEKSEEEALSYISKIEI
jgi:hypothetical protein